MTLKNAHRGFSLIEVLVALLIMSIGLLGAAAIQLNALKYTDSSSMRTQASFIAYDMLDRIRANSTLNYSLASAKAVASSTDYSNPRAIDWSDFKSNIASFSGGTGDGVIAITNNVVTITIKWTDVRAGQAINAINSTSLANDTSVQSFVLTTRAFNDTVNQ